MIPTPLKWYDVSGFHYFSLGEKTQMVSRSSSETIGEPSILISFCNLISEISLSISVHQQNFQEFWFQHSSPCQAIQCSYW